MQNYRPLFCPWIMDLNATRVVRSLKHTSATCERRHTFLGGREEVDRGGTHVPTETGFPLIFWFLFQADNASQFKSHWMPPWWFQTWLLKRKETWTFSKKSKFCFGTSFGAGYWVNLRETFLWFLYRVDSKTWASTAMHMGLLRSCELQIKDIYVREMVTSTFWIWRLIRIVGPSSQQNQQRQTSAKNWKTSHLQFAINFSLWWCLWNTGIFWYLPCNGAVTIQAFGSPNK